MFYVNRRLRVIGRKLATPEAYSGLPPAARVAVHEALLDHMDLIGTFAVENPFGLGEADLDVVRSWRHLVAGKFYAFRQLRDSMVFLSTTEPVVAYGVLALSDPFEDLIGPDLPRLINTTLLPFKGRIVYDGIMTGYDITFGRGVKGSLSQNYEEIKGRAGIVTSLPPAALRPRPARKTAASRERATEVGTTRGGAAATSQAGPTHDKIVGLIDAFCRERLDEEYRALCRGMAGVLARKRPSPLTRGKPESWASGIVRAVGWANFLGDPSQPLHMKMTDIDEAFGVSEATGSAKSTAIRDLLKIGRLDPRWTVPGLMDRNPLVWMLKVNGLVVDIRDCPREAQVVAFEQGLIPYIPDDRRDESSEG